MTASYDEVVEIEITFKGSDGHSATALITFVVMPQLSSPMILGCPTLDKLLFAMTSNVVELRAYDLELPAVAPETHTAEENVASLREPVTIYPEEMRELWIPIQADPSKQWMVKGVAHAHPSVRIAEGPARIVDGKVRIFACTEGREKVSLGVVERIAQLATPTEEDIKEQDMIRWWRMKSLKSNTEALGPNYCASLINLSEIDSHESIEMTQ